MSGIYRRNLPDSPLLRRLSSASIVDIRNDYGEHRKCRLIREADDRECRSINVLGSYSIYVVAFYCTTTS
jgi:hypothetical protein